jgi:MFS family permease
VVGDTAGRHCGKLCTVGAALTRKPEERMQGHDRRYLVLAAMVFSVAMMFVDQTIVAIAAPNIQRSLSLSATGTQWMINSYLLALAALIALGGKISDVFGHRRMVIAGTIGFAAPRRMDPLQCGG